MFYCEWWSTTGSQRLLEEEASNGPGETPKCLDAGVPPFILLSLCLLLSLFYLFFLFSFCQARFQSCIVWPRHWGILDVLKGRIWLLAAYAWASQKLLRLKMMLKKIRINILRTPILRLFNRLHGDMAQQNISRGNALAQFCFLPSNLYLVHHQTKVLLYLLKYLHSKCLVLCNINCSVSWAHFNWDFDASIMNCWYWSWRLKIIMHNDLGSQPANFYIELWISPPSLQGELRNHPTKEKSADLTKSGKIHAVPNKKSKIGQICTTNFCFEYLSKYYRLVIFKRQRNVICGLGIVRHTLIIVLCMRVPSLSNPWLKKKLFHGKLATLWFLRKWDLNI